MNKSVEITCAFCKSTKVVPFTVYMDMQDAFDGKIFCNGGCFKRYKEAQARHIETVCAACGIAISGNKHLLTKRRSKGAIVYFCSDACKQSMYPRRRNK
jgi:hypothetical protein